MGTFLQKTSASATRNPLRQPASSSLPKLRHLCHPGTRFKKQMEATSLYTKLPIYYGMKEITTFSQFCLGMTKTSNRLSYLTLQPQGNLCKLITHFCNLSVYCKFIEPCLNTPGTAKGSNHSPISPPMNTVTAHYYSLLGGSTNKHSECSLLGGNTLFLVSVPL